MKKDRLNQLFRAAARVEVTAGTDALPERVLRAVQRERVAPRSALFEQLGHLLPRVALAAAIVVITCLAVELRAHGDLSIGAVQLSEQWLFAIN